MIYLKDFNFIVLNSSGGKDSVCALWEVVRQAKVQGFPLENIIVSHQILKGVEWPGVKELVEEQCAYLGLNTPVFTTRKNKDQYEETLLEYARRRGKWPSSSQRWCTSDFKRSPGSTVVTSLTKLEREGKITVARKYSVSGKNRKAKKIRVLYVFGFRSEESPARAKKVVMTFNDRLSFENKSTAREVWDWCPILDWSLSKVWDTIKRNALPYHFAYDLGMPRLSCVFCVLAPFEALVIGGIHNPELLDEYIEVEEETGHLFRPDFSLKQVKQAVLVGYQPKKISTWTM